MSALAAHRPEEHAAAGGPSGAQVLLFAVACGVTVGNIYYAQPLLATIGANFGASPAALGLLITVTQIGYALGLLFLAPLGDLFENRRLIGTILVFTVVSLGAAAAAPSFGAFLAASLAIGVTSVVAQILIPLAAHRSPEAIRGRVVGQVMSGLLTGILLARAVAGVVANSLGWRSIYALSAALVAVLLVVLMRNLPVRHPAFGGSYGALIASLGRIFMREPQLRRRAAYQSAMFGAFSAFWTAITFVLAGAPYHFSQAQIGLFALAGAASAVFAPIAGRLGDRGHGRIVTGAAFVLAGAGLALTLLWHALWALVIGAIVLDVAVQASLVIGQRTIYALNPAERSRLNTLYIATFFIGGAIASALSTTLFERLGWPAVVAFAAALPSAALVGWLTEPRDVAAAAPAVHA